TRVEKSCADRTVAIAAIFFDQDAVDAQEIAQDANTAFGRGAVTGNGGGVLGRITEGAEDTEIDRRFQRRGSLISQQHVKNWTRRQRLWGIIRRLKKRCAWRETSLKLKSECSGAWR